MFPESSLRVFDNFCLHNETVDKVGKAVGSDDGCEVGCELGGAEGFAINTDGCEVGAGYDGLDVGA